MDRMREGFERLAGRVFAGLTGDEVALCNFSGEDSTFVRFNRSRVRQAGDVVQQYLNVRLVDGARHASETITVGSEDDAARVDAVVASLRHRLGELPDDPHLLLPDRVASTESVHVSRLPDPFDALAPLIDGTRDRVGLWASGGLVRGFASSTGQRNWFARHSYSLDWCDVHAGDKAVKTSLAGFDFDPAELARKDVEARAAAAALARPVKRLSPGGYRAWLTPSAVEEIAGLISGAFSEASVRTASSPWLKLSRGERALHPSVSFVENTADGAAPPFQDDGFLRPDRVALVQAGAWAGTLISPRSAREWSLATNGASESEGAQSLEIGGGALPIADAQRALGDGVWVSNLWYLNWSDRAAARVTGMTRFATFWVEGGEIAQPIEVMRFDDSLYDLFGDRLDALSAERETMLSNDTYGERKAESRLVPGALLKELRFTL